MGAHATGGGARLVVVPLDGSPFAERAVAHAEHIVRAPGGRVNLITVSQPRSAALPHPVAPMAVAVVPPAIPVPAGSPDLTAARREYLDEMARRIAGRGSAQVSAEVLSGDVVETIASHAEAIGADAIVMCTHGRGGLNRVWLGSVADGLVRRSDVPVMLIRKGDDPTAERLDFRRVLVPLDGSDVGEGIIPALSLVAADEPEISLLRVMEPRTAVAVASLAAPSVILAPESAPPGGDVDAYLDEMAERLRGSGFRVRAETAVHTSAARAILECADALGADLIAMSTHGHGGVRRLLVWSVADKVLRAASTRVLLHRAAAG
jgi:nucleotide-binding universal stress UspA family protein